MPKPNITRFANLSVDPSIDPANLYKLFKCPNITEAERDEIPKDGLSSGIIIYNKTALELQTYDGATEEWIQAAASSSTGLKVPNLTTEERDAIEEPLEGTIIYNTSMDALQFYDATAKEWMQVAASNATGLQVPNITIAQRDAMIDVMDGTLIYNKDIFVLQAYDKESEQWNQAAASITTGLQVLNLTTTQRDNMLAPTDGTMIYNKDSFVLQIYDQALGQWNQVAASFTTGLQVPNITTAQRDAMLDIMDGTIIYNTDLFVLQTYDESTGQWNQVAASPTTGVQIMNLTTAQRDAITDPMDGTLIYNTNLAVLQIYDKTSNQWMQAAASPTTGLQVPNLTTIDRDSIINPENGTIIFHTDANDLEVYDNGMWYDILDKSVATIPPGAMMLWGGELPPADWRECDGSELDRTEFTELFAAISTNWGNGDGSTTFNIPDCRGVFVRGWAHGESTDPNRTTRSSRNGGNSGDRVGSYQADELKSHRHNIQSRGGAVGSGGASEGNPNSQIQTDYTGGAETRPRNVYAMYIIKVK